LRDRWRRTSDLLWLGVATTLFLPIATAIAAAILLDDGRPLLFAQSRLGRARRPFDILKFRTMRAGAVTRVGRLLRVTGLAQLHAGAGPRKSLAWDRLYGRGHGFPLDARVLALTFVMNFTGKTWVRRNLLRARG
jgi:hypothetical protein